jgi:uncharacterized protein YjbI with pentapeptide repeats
MKRRGHIVPSGMTVLLVSGLLAFSLLQLIYPQTVNATEGNERSEIPADVILQMITDGEPVKIWNAVITGDLYLAGSTEAYEKVESSIYFFNCVFEGNVGFKLVSFESDVHFVDVVFRGNQTYFETVVFGKYVSFREAHFERRASFTWSRFKSETWFMGATFQQYISFSQTFFEGPAEFLNSTYMAKANFAMATFNNDLDFRGAVFKNEADFHGVLLGGNTLFFGASFEGDVLPPRQFEGASLGLFWDQVKHTIPSGWAVESYTAWENLFLAEGDFGEARRVRRASLRHELNVWILSWFAISLSVLFAFTLTYLKRFQYFSRHSWRQNFGKVLLFSLDVMTPGIGAYKYKWEKSIPVEDVVVLTAFESALGWIILGVGAALGVTWLTA